MITTAGSINKSRYFLVTGDASHASPGDPITGLLFSDFETGGSASYTRQGAASVDLELITLASASAAHDDGGFIEVDATKQPGIYRCDFPDAAWVTGVDQVICALVAAPANNAFIAPIMVDITDVDFRDAASGGMSTLADWVNGGRLDLILDIIANDTTIDIPALIAALNDLSAAQVNAEVDTALTDYGANTVVPDPAGTAPTAVQNRQEMDSNSTGLAKLGTPAVDVSADILSIKGDTQRTQVTLSGTPTTTVMLTNLPLSDSNAYENAFLRFKDDTTTVSLRKQVRKIAASSTSGPDTQLTTQAFATTPVSGDTAELISK